MLRQVKTVSGRKMIHLFTKKYGKISAGSPWAGKLPALAFNPFAYGSYEIFQNPDSYNLSSGETKNSFYRIGEDIDKYVCASFILELTDKLLPEESPQPRLFDLLLGFLQAMEKRAKGFGTLTLAYEVKAIEILGAFPEINCCVSCGGKDSLEFFSVTDGGMLCRDCGEKKQANIENQKRDRLIFQPGFDIVNILKYFLASPLYMFEKIALDKGVAEGLQGVLRGYMSYHMDIGTLKSESIFNKNF